MTHNHANNTSSKEWNKLDERERNELLGSVRVALGDLRYAAEAKPSRPLSLAITKLEEAVHWLEDPSILASVNASEGQR